jgi:hypothetical protein
VERLCYSSYLVDNGAFSPREAKQASKDFLQPVCGIAGSIVERTDDRQRARDAELLEKPVRFPRIAEAAERFSGAQRAKHLRLWPGVSIGAIRGVDRNAC